MWVVFKLNAKKLKSGKYKEGKDFDVIKTPKSVTISETNYPSDIFLYWAANELAAIGIYKVDVFSTQKEQHIEDLQEYEYILDKDNQKVKRKEIIKRRKKKDVQASFTQLITEHQGEKYYDVKVFEGKEYDGGNRALTHIHQTFSRAIASKVANTSFSVDWISTKNDVVTMNADKFIEFGESVFGGINTLLEDARVTKDNIEKINNLEEARDQYTAFVARNPIIGK
jgi:hypothetical protein